MLMADLARASLETGDAKNACAYAAYAYRLLPASPMTADMFGYTLLRTGSSGQPAVDLLEKAVALAPGHPLLQMHLGQAYAAVGRKDEAYALLTQAAAVPGNPYRRQAVEALAAL
jgi:Flp pilus assembly protein TadD